MGCILAEMILRRPFLRGDTTRNQLKLIFELLGTPTHEYLAQFQDPHVRDNLVKVVQECGVKGGIGLEKIFGHINKDCK